MKVEIQTETLERIVIDILVDHYPVLVQLENELPNDVDKKFYRGVRKSFRHVIEYFGGDVK
jgi:hypothetical protein